MKLTNLEIYNIAETLTSAFKDCTIYIPVKANFYLQKNIKAFTDAAQEIDKVRMEIAKRFGEDQGNGSYNVPKEHLQEANLELEKLFAIEQEIEIKKFKLEDLGEINLTPAQMQALFIMIEEE